MEQHGLKQSDLTDCAPQSRISDILSAKRKISKEVAKRSAAKFNVGVDLFLRGVKLLKDILREHESMQPL